MSTVIAPSSVVASSAVESSATEALAYASIARGTLRGYYRVLFEAGPVDAAAFAGFAGISVRESQEWLGQQLALGLLRPLAGPVGIAEAPLEVYLPGEFVPVLIDGRGLAEFDSARGMFAARVDELPEVLRSLWQGTEDPVDDLSRGIGRLWARMFATAR